MWLIPKLNTGKQHAVTQTSRMYQLHSILLIFKRLKTDPNVPFDKFCITLEHKEHERLPRRQK